MEQTHPANLAGAAPESAATELLPLSIGDVFDEAFDLYKRNFALFAGIAAVVSVPAQILSQLANMALGVDKLAAKMNDGSAGSIDPSTMASTMFGLMAVSFAQLVAFTFAHVVQSGALTIAVSERYLGRTITLGRAYRQAWNRIGPLLLTWLLVALITGIGAAGLLLALGLVSTLVVGVLAMSGPAAAAVGAGIAIALLLAGCLAAAVGLVFIGLFATQIVTIEGIAYGRAMERNWFLVRTRILPIAFSVLLLWLLQVCIWGGMLGFSQIVLGYAVFPLLQTLAPVRDLVTGSISAVAWMLLEPIWLVSVTLLYYDQRVRREGFDLTVLDRQVHAMTSTGRDR